VPDFEREPGPGANGAPLPRRPQGEATLPQSENPNPQQAKAFKQLPDLTPTDMRINRDAQLEVFVQNKGFGPSPECNLGIKYFYPKGEPYSMLVGPGAYTAGIPALQKGEGAWVTDPNVAVWGSSIPVKGADKVIAHVDPEKWDDDDGYYYDGGAQVEELRKDNNELTRATLIIPGTGSTSSPAQSRTSVLPQRPQTGSSPPTDIKTNTPVSVPDVPPYKPLPDLVVTDMNIDAEGFLHVRVENKGVGAAAECLLMMVPGKEYQPFSCYNVPQLGKGEGVWVKVRSPQAKQISVTVDPLIDYDNGYDNPIYISPKVEELHEDNNVFTLEKSP
jgi:hypothetical protein